MKKADRSLTDKTLGTSGYSTSFVFKQDKYPLLKELYGERYVEYRRRWSAGKTEEYPDFPLNIDIVPNEACNLRCVICPLTEKQRSGRGCISGEILERIHREAVEHRLCAINIGGIEPLSHKASFLDVLKISKAIAPIDLMIHTNGTMLAGDVLEAIMDAGVTTLCVSLDSATPATYRAVRGKDYLPRIEQSLIRLAELKQERRSHFPLVQLSFCVNPLNFSEREMFVEQWQHVGQQFCFQQYRWEKGVNIEPTEEFEPIPEIDCDSPFLRCAVAPNGDVFPCCSSRNEDLILGNILETSIYELWHGDKMQGIRRSLKDRPDLRCKTCKACVRSFYDLKA